MPNVKCGPLANNTINKEKVCQKLERYLKNMLRL